MQDATFTTKEATELIRAGEALIALGPGALQAARVNDFGKSVPVAGWGRRIRRKLERKAKREAK